ncbi:hypothetical protein [Clostridium tagluense]|uniref:hypothetical protein n=1 Tax=Clostridium tagluense TaxID=360422 RepID=UPI001CF3B8E8|nr:hypothetical protein [Clostridium tagluense]MCB2298670.1 hypothetical protein [Clostridium tagluense]
MNAFLPIIFGLGYTLGPITIGKALGYISIESAWLVLGLVAFISTIFMCMLEKYDENQKKKKKNFHRNRLNVKFHVLLKLIAVFLSLK